MNFKMIDEQNITAKKNLFWNVLVVMLFILMVMPAGIRAQSDYESYYNSSLRINNIGMIVLGSWAITNISVGAYGWSKQSGQRSYFHQMNMFWNTVNLGIAGIALYGNLADDYSLLTGEELLEKQFKVQRLFLINGLLDVAYVSGGVLLNRLAPKYPDKELRFRGYGNSVFLQGSFLFVFDFIMYGIQRSHRADFLQQLSFSPMHDAFGFALTYQF